MTPIPYTEDVRPQDTDRAQSTVLPSLFPSELKPWAVDFDGRCPRCSHPIRARRWLVTVRGALRLDDRQMELLASQLDAHGIDRSSGDETFDLTCSCVVPHPGQPTGRAGCGARFRVRVTWP